MNSLLPFQLQQLNKYFKIDIKENSLKKLAGGDVNTSFLCSDNKDFFVIKMINLLSYGKDYHATRDEILNSLIFSENIACQLKHFTHCISALSGSNSYVLETKDHAIMLYPYTKGYIIDEKNIATNHLQSIAHALQAIHQAPITFDQDFAETKINKFKLISEVIFDHSIWKWLNRLSTSKLILPKNHLASEYLLKNRSRLVEHLLLMQSNCICHNDLKPKNVLWGHQDNFWIIDWETAGLFNKAVDFFDTLFAWSTSYSNYKLTLDEQKAQIFITHYGTIELNSLDHIHNILLVKWYFWLGYCFSYFFSKKLFNKNYLWHINYSLAFIEFLLLQKPIDKVFNMLSTKS